MAKTNWNALLENRCPKCGEPLERSEDGEDWICELFGSPELMVNGTVGEDGELIEAKTEEKKDRGVIGSVYDKLAGMVSSSPAAPPGRYVSNRPALTPFQLSALNRRRATQLGEGPLTQADLDGMEDEDYEFELDLIH